MAHEMMMAGDRAPVFEGTTADGRPFGLTDQRGKWVALFFFPEAGTSL